MRKRLLVALATAGIIGGGVYGFAATLGVGSDNLAAGSDGIAACDADGVTVVYEVAWEVAIDAYEVTSVDVTGIDSVNCANHELQVTLTNLAGDRIGTSSAEIPVDAGNELITSFAADNIAAELVENVHVAIDGVDVGTDND